MKRKRVLAGIGGATLLVLGVWQVLGSDEQAAVAAPVPAPLRQAAGTPVTGHVPALAEAAEPDFAAPPDMVQTVAAEDAPAPVEAISEACPVTLDAFADLGAVISLTLTAPCYPNERVVLRHAGLAVTYQTTATGSLFADIPALDAAGRIEARFADGSGAQAAAPVEDLSGMHRFAVQGMAEDGLVLSGGDDLRLLGNGDVPQALLAQVVTLAGADIAVETEVTATRCGREVMGEMILSEGGKATTAELTLALPDCDEAGGFVVLNNPVGNMKLAATE